MQFFPPKDYIPEPSGGVICPYGCKGISFWRLYGLVEHLMNFHAYNEKDAWKQARKV